MLNKQKLGDSKIPKKLIAAVWNAITGKYYIEIIKLSFL